MRLLNNKPVQTFLAVGPVLLLGLCLVSYFAFFVSAFGRIDKTGSTDLPPAYYFNGVNMFLVLVIGTSLLFILGTVYFVLHAAQNPLLENGDMKIVWILIIILLSGIGSLVYWLLEIRNKIPEPVIGDSFNRKKNNEWSGGLYIKS